MKIGYARVSSGEQNLDLQRDALSAAGCSMIHEDEGVSGAARRRPGLDQALATMKAGDALVTWRLDRLGRSLPHLIELVAALQAKGCEFVSLSEAIDSTSQLRKAEEEIGADRETVSSMAILFGVNRSTLWRAMRDRLGAIGKKVTL